MAVTPQGALAFATVLALVLAETCAARTVRLDGPAEAKRYDVAEYTLTVADPTQANPSTKVEVSAEFARPDGNSIKVDGFCDSRDGTTFRVRFCPDTSGATYRYRIAFRDPAGREEFAGELRCIDSDNLGPVIVDPQHPKHFICAGSGKPFYHVGNTAYHLMDPTNDDAQVRATVDYCVRYGFNKIRFLLTGYPRDTDNRPRTAERPGRPGDWNGPNYGALPGEVNPLPAWQGQPHKYDFTRFNPDYWQRVDRAVRYMRERGVIATCIMTIEKQNLPSEYGKLTEQEYRLYRYAIARLAAFDNVWWDLGNEHNEYRDKAWGDTMGAFVKQCDPYHRLASAHGYADFWYTGSPWADFIITQQYGDERTVNDWVLKFGDVPKPYVNEEYGYEGDADKPGHGHNTDWARRCHWAIAMAGGYATYGDWHDGSFYTGEPSAGKAPAQLRLLRTFFEALPVSDMTPRNDLVDNGFALALPDQLYVVYLPRGGKVRVALPQGKRFSAQWFNPRTGERQGVPGALDGPSLLSAPDSLDWVALVRQE